VVVHKVQSDTKSGSSTITTSKPSELSVPPVIITKYTEETEVNWMKAQIATYQRDMALLTSTMETMNAMLELLLT
jgi:hypothetical protein